MQLLSGSPGWAGMVEWGMVCCESALRRGRHCVLLPKERGPAAVSVHLSWNQSSVNAKERLQLSSAGSGSCLLRIQLD